MRDISRSKRILLITLAGGLIIVSGILFVLGGSASNRVPKDEPAATPQTATIKPLPQVTHQPAETVEQMPVQTTTEAQTAVAGASTTNQAEQKPEPAAPKKTGIRAFISNIFRKS